jgi:tetratricopeptide (TPR) repeat protein
MSTRPRAVTELALRRLSDAHLVEEPEPGRYRMHDLIKTYAVRCSAGGFQDDVDQALDRLRDFYLLTVRAATDLAYPSNARPVPPPASSVQPLAFHGPAAATEWLDQERASVVAAIRQAAGENPPLPWAWMCAEQLMRYFWCSRHNSDWLAAGTAGLTAAHRLDDPGGQATMLNFLGVAHWARGEFDTAIRHTVDALAVNERMNARDRQSANLSNLCGLYRAVGNIAEAITCGERAMDLFAKDGNVIAKANAACNLSIVEVDRGQLHRALRRARTALRAYRACRYTDGQASALLVMSDVYRDLGQPGAAADLLRKVMELPSHDRGQVNTIYARAGKLIITMEPTSATLAEALDLLAEAHELGDAQVEAEVRCTAGDIAHRSGQPRQAVEHYESALALSRRIGETDLVIGSLCGLAASRNAADPAPEHLAEITEAIEIAVRVGLVLREGKARTIDAEMALALGRIAHAQLAATAALRIHARCGTEPWRRRTEAVLRGLAV